MRLSWTLVACFALDAAGQTAPTTTTTSSSTEQADQLKTALQLVAQMPSCAQNCIAQAVAASGQSAGSIDITASCSNETATVGIEACAMAACTIREQLTAKNLTETLCQRPVRRGSNVSVASLTGLSCAIVAFLMRMASKLSFPCVPGARIDANLWWDDLAIGLAMVLLFPISVLSNVLNSLGIGRDVWTIPFADLTRILKLYYMAELLYLLTLPTIKIGILCTYLRIFQQTTFRKLTYVVIALNVAYAVTFIIITVFQCSPVDFAWHGWDGESPGRCNNINVQSWASAIINILLDLAVIALPMPMLWRMNLNARKKLLVMLMFGVGFFVTIVSILRLQILIKFGNSANLTYDYKNAGYWTSIEINTALCCACMPGIRNLIRRFLPRLMGNTTSGVTGAGGTGLSGRTAVGSNSHKGVEILVRTRDSEDRTFIPLENVSTKDTPMNSRSSRNFSRPQQAHGWGGEA